VNLLKLKQAFGLLILAASSVQVLAADLRDPMRPANIPAATARPGPVGLKLEAVMSTGSSRLAIVNGKVVRVGDTLASATIVDITSNSIRYTRGGKELVATLPDNRLPVRVNHTLQAGQP
jgi:hypothetical protein